MARGDPRILPGPRAAQNVSRDTFRYRDGPGGRSAELIDTGTRTGTLYERMARTGSEPASLGPSPLALAGGEHGARMRAERDAARNGGKPAVTPAVQPQHPLLAVPKEGRMDSVDWYCRGAEFRAAHPHLSPFGQPAGARTAAPQEPEAFPLPDLPTFDGES